MQTNTQLQTIIKPSKVLVLGGNGFIGRYTIAALKKHGINTLIGSRHVSENAQTHIQVQLHKTLSEQAWELKLHGIDAVINTVGILRERKGESYDQVHHSAVAALARVCKKRNIPLVHMSALGIGLLNNEFAKSKFRGETAIRESGCAGAIVRASIVNAPDGYGAGWMYRVAKWPIWLVPGGATKLLCPIQAKDLGEALAKLAVIKVQHADKELEILEVGGPEVFTLKTYLSKLRAEQECLPTRPLFILNIPSVVAKYCAKLLDIFHLTPYSVGHHELLESDNIPDKNSLTEILGRAPSPVGKNPDVVEGNKLIINHKHV